MAAEARAALTLRLVCGLTTAEIARAFLVSETTLAQRLVRAKRKVADAGVPFEIPGPAAWPARLDAVLATLEIAYAKAHEDAAGAGPHAGYAQEMLELTRVLRRCCPWSRRCSPWPPWSATPRPAGRRGWTTMARWSPCPSRTGPLAAAR